MSLTAINPVQPVDAEVISLEVFADYLSESIILSKTDLGSTLVYKVKHAQRGALVLVNTTGDNNAVVYI